MTTEFRADRRGSSGARRDDRVVESARHRIEQLGRSPDRARRARSRFWPTIRTAPSRAPSLRYWVHLVAPGWNVIGGGEPALPGVVHRAQRARRLGPDDLRQRQRGPLRLRDEPGERERVSLPGPLGSRCGSSATRFRQGREAASGRAEVHAARPGALRGSRQPQGRMRCARRGSSRAARRISPACGWIRRRPGRSSARRAATTACRPRT